jgi:hypothetical protein
MSVRMLVTIVTAAEIGELERDVPRGVLGGVEGRCTASRRQGTSARQFGRVEGRCRSRPRLDAAVAGRLGTELCLEAGHASDEVGTTPGRVVCLGSITRPRHRRRAPESPRGMVVMTVVGEQSTETGTERKMAYRDGSNVCLQRFVQATKGRCPHLDVCS